MRNLYLLLLLPLLVSANSCKEEAKITSAPLIDQKEDQNFISKDYLASINSLEGTLYDPWSNISFPSTTNTRINNGVIPYVGDDPNRLKNIYNPDFDSSPID